MTNQSDPSPKQSNNTTRIVGIVIVVIIAAVLAIWLFSGQNSGGAESAPTATPTTDAGAIGTPPVPTATAAPDAGDIGTPAVPTPTPAQPETSGAVDAPTIQNITWTWVDRTNPSDGSSETIDSPASYTLLFQADGSYQFQADCNSGSGTYTADQPGAIRMTAGPMTLAECSEGSCGQDMLDMMQAVQDYRVEENGSKLVLVWPAGGAEDGYRGQ